MGREISIGAGLAVFIFLAVQGYDVMPFAVIAGLLLMLKFVVTGKGTGRRFEVVNGVPAGGGSAVVTFDQVGGQEVAKRELLEALDFVKKLNDIAKMGIRPLKGILLTGPPGTGKTLLAKASANYIDSVFVASSGSEFVEMYAGVGAQRVRQLFKNAKESAVKSGKKNAVIFIDEIEVLGGKRGKHSSHLEYDQTLNQLLVEMDGISTSNDVNILVLAATNRADLLDDALLRPGRFDRQVKVDLPDKEGRFHILNIHLKNRPIADDVVFEELAKETFGFSGAHLENLCNEAAILAMREGEEKIGMSHFKEAIDKVTMGERLDRSATREELRRIAIHETGHALVSEYYRKGSVSSITITSRGNALGYVRQVPEKDIYLYTRDYLENQIAICVAGSIAEELVYGNRSTGGKGDIDQAVGIAKTMIASGMSQLGIVSHDDIPDEIYHNAIREIISKQEANVRELLKANHVALNTIADTLVDKEKMTGDDFRLLIKPAA